MKFNQIHFMIYVVYILSIFCRIICKLQLHYLFDCCILLLGALHEFIFVIWSEYHDTEALGCLAAGTVVVHHTN